MNTARALWLGWNGFDTSAVLSATNKCELKLLRMGIEKVSVVKVHSIEALCVEVCSC